MTLKEKLTKINEDRYVDDDFIKELEELGFEIREEGPYNDKFIRIGDRDINATTCRADAFTANESERRTKADLCRLLEKTIEDAYRKANADDKCVESFFHTYRDFAIPEFFEQKDTGDLNE